MSEYEQQALDFMSAAGITFEARFLRYDKHFPDDADKRDIYDCVFKRSDSRRTLSVTFGNSINSSGRFMIIDRGRHLFNTQQQARSWKMGSTGSWTAKIEKNPTFKEPTAYDVIACLTKQDPYSLEEFCSDFGYNSDSKKHTAIYEAVLEEWKNVQYFFTKLELEQIQEIQ